MERDIILVPTDFTPVADCAMDHAIEIAKLFNHRICMLHVIPKKTTAGQKEKIETQLQKIAKNHADRSSLQITSRVEAGSIFDEISNTANRIYAEFIIMGIHGKKGVQHILGSYAYKVISSSNVPVLVVKQKNHHVGYDKIVIPIDFSVDSSQKINKAIRFAKYFDSTIHIIGVLGSSSKVSKINKEVLLKKVHNYILDAGVKSTHEVLIRPGSEIHEEVLCYAEKVDADLIMIVAEKSGPFTEFLGRNEAEQIIDKADIPVLTIIPNEEYDDDDDNSMLSTFFDPLGLIDKP
jgi:nucleotide-binding universal stress UspA family protein